MKTLIFGVLAGIAISTPLERRIRQEREAWRLRRGFADFIDQLNTWEDARGE